ncbi:sarcosine oxidase subunit gamma [Gymnodinialimonas sp.]
MASLTPKTAFDGLLPVTSGTVTLSELTPEAITWIAPAKGRMAAVSKALEKQIKAPFPEPGKISGPAVWTGPGQAMVLGPALKPIKDAAFSDQTSAWACCALEGATARDVLARLVPIDLRAQAFKTGHCARTLLGHMNCVLMHPAKDRFEIMVFRSMAATATHELTRAMDGVAARYAVT